MPPILEVEIIFWEMIALKINLYFKEYINILNEETLILKVSIHGYEKDSIMEKLVLLQDLRTQV